MAGGSLTNYGQKTSSSGADTVRTQIPEFLEPFIRRGASTADRALGSLEGILGLTGGPGSYNAGPPRPLPNVRTGFGQQVYVDPAQGAFTTSDGSIIAPFQDGVIPGITDGTDNPVEVRGGTIVGVGNGGLNELGSLGAAAYGGWGGGAAQNLVAPFSDTQQVAQALGVERALLGDLFSTAQNSTQQLAANGFDASGLTTLSDLGVSPEVLQGLAGISSTSGSGLDALASTASGDFLYGGEGFDAAVDAAVRAATPGILSTFGSAGAGGATGGLAQEAIGRAAVDAVASQYGAERQNQLRAAGLLGDLGLSSSGLLGQFGLAGGDQALRQQIGVADANARSAQTQLDASQLLPGLASADVDLLNRIGGVQQAQAQSELDAPRAALMQLLSAALGGSPIESLLGTDATNRARETVFGLSATGSFGL